MSRNDGYRRYFEAAALLGQITRARAEELVRELMSGGDVQRSQAQEWVDELVDRSRKAAEDLLDLVRTEVSNQMQGLGLDPDDLARQAADLLRRSAGAGRRVAQDMTSGGAKKAKKSSAKKSAKKALEKAAKNGPKKAAKKAAGGKRSSVGAGGSKKAPAGKKTAAKKAPAGKKTTAAKKTAASASTAKKSPGRTGPRPRTRTPAAPASTR